ncbi:phospholipase D Active site motif family protein [Janthinobacterium agaricidamnosum NBRC 102515 = DSM 9628]|uniref:Cardiolipin synthase n=1 Tax=Janthinobacterium agaricidamnosum NBRC 102515 = DSM 9628 TaxID=1349767 RepID=W0VAS1_9BURK|nr:phospholipase D Active site motif family protein [Janthinobacterium agaricidamnosum NBRC 102515 = DSM 9628]
MAACASLPDVKNLSASLEPKATPSVTTGKGALLAVNSRSALMAKRWARSGMDLKTQAALEEAATGVPLIKGNKVTLLFDGPQTMEQMYQAIAAAQNNINLETYIFDQDELGLKFADMLIEKQQAGITVNVIYDSVGTIGVPQAFFDRMRNAGIHLVAFNPVNPAKLRGDEWKINNRDHRKVLIVDGKIAFTGGINISDTYAKSSLFRSKSKPTDKKDVGWRDTHVKVEGPAVAAFQWMFIKTWTRQDAADLPDSDYFPVLSEVGDKLVRVIASEPGGGFEIYKAYILAIQEAKKSIHITSAYFVPDQQTVDALSAAAKRGVDIKVILPGVSDSGLVFHAGHALYEQLLASGIKIYHLQLAVLHAKTAVIDGAWSTVGSTNIDMRSFLHNSELNVVVLGDSFGREMENAFREDLRDSVQITKEKWDQRPLGDRLKEWAARFMNYWL